MKKKYPRVVVKAPKETGKCVQGQNAVANGRMAELTVEDIFEDVGFITVQWKEKDKVDLKLNPNVIYRNTPYTSFIGKPGKRGDYYIVSERFENPIRLECRTQRVAGSAEDKLSTLFKNCKAFPEKDVIIVMEGDGFSEEWRPWMKAQAAAVTSKNMYVINMAELKDWADRTFIDK